ncbi:MAG: oxygen-independent coproporphyrinogen III oxidase [Spongiibacteraceae bacterium]
MNRAATPLNFQRALIEKYSVAGPRYTSYPTAVQFSEGFGADSYRQLWTGVEKSTAALSLYVHIPFCENICYYCACNKVVTRQKHKARQYLDYLEKEIRLQSALIGKNRPVTQLHWGGGTPTFLSAAELTELMYHIASHFNLLDDPQREYSIEVDPRTVDKNILALLKGIGFNRLSFGVQDFDERVQEAVNRVQPFEQIEALNTAARDLGFSSISIDLIYGLPHQTPESLRHTLEQALALKPDRIAFYNYAHMPHLFSSQRSIDRLTLPTPSEKLALLELANAVLGTTGYLHIGMDHFVRAEDGLAQAQLRGTLQRNFQGYSTCMAADLVGLGVSAISSTAHGYAQNAKNLTEYYGLIDADKLPVTRGLCLSRDDKIRRAAIMQMICNLSLDTSALEKQYGICFADYFERELAELERLAGDGLVSIEPSRLIVTSTGRFLLRNICMVFDRYLPPLLQRSFSKAI